MSTIVFTLFFIIRGLFRARLEAFTWLGNIDDGEYHKFRGYENLAWLCIIATAIIATPPLWFLVTILAYIISLWPYERLLNHCLYNDMWYEKERPYKFGSMNFPRPSVRQHSLLTCVAILALFVINT